MSEVASQIAVALSLLVLAAVCGYVKGAADMATKQARQQPDIQFVVIRGAQE